MLSLLNLTRQALPWLVFSLPMLLLIYFVIMVGASILSGLGDASGGGMLRWCGVGVVLLFAGCSITLLFILGIERLVQNQEIHRS